MPLLPPLPLPPPGGCSVVLALGVKLVVDAGLATAPFLAPTMAFLFSMPPGAVSLGREEGKGVAHSLHNFLWAAAGAMA